MTQGLKVKVDAMQYAGSKGCYVKNYRNVS
jgi:hypothetical protein